MIAPFLIKCTHGSLSLELRAENEDFIIAKISDVSLRGEARVGIFMSQGIGDFFGNLATNWTGWEGNKEWASLEGELKLKASCDCLGHIFLSVDLKNGAPPIWQIQAELVLEAGQLNRIAGEARAFESVVFNAA